MIFLGRRLFNFFNNLNRMHSVLHFVEKQHKEGDNETLWIST